MSYFTKSNFQTLVVIPLAVSCFRYISVTRFDFKTNIEKELDERTKKLIKRFDDNNKKKPLTKEEKQEDKQRCDRQNFNDALKQMNEIYD
jgi:hypothetical protein